VFVCPICKFSLEKNLKKKYLYCKNKKCKLFNENFKLYDDIPVIIPFGFQDCIFKKTEEERFINLGSKNRGKSKKIVKFKNLFRRLIYGENSKTNKNFESLNNVLEKNSKILIIGGGSIGIGMNDFLKNCKSKNIRVESLDVYYSENITTIADAHYLPFANQSFDAVVVQAVLEHVLNPERVVFEIYRVLNKGGYVYSETPFMQSIHEGPFDFYRFSHSAHRWLFRKFEEIESGAHQGGFSSLLFISSHVLSGIFRNKKIGIIVRIIFTRFCSILDNLLSQTSNIDVASGCFFFGKKSIKTIQENQIVDYYRGNQL